MRIVNSQAVFTDVMLLDVLNDQTQQATSFFLHLDAVGRPNSLVVSVPFERWLRISSHARSELGCHALVNFAISNFLQEGWWLDFLFSVTEKSKVYENSHQFFTHIFIEIFFSRVFNINMF